MKRFEKGMELNLLRQNGDDAVRTAKVTGINREVNKIRIQIGNQIFIGDIKEDSIQDSEVMVAEFGTMKQYLAPYAKDSIQEVKTVVEENKEVIKEEPIKEVKQMSNKELVNSFIKEVKSSKEVLVGVRPSEVSDSKIKNAILKSVNVLIKEYAVANQLTWEQEKALKDINWSINR